MDEKFCDICHKKIDPILDRIGFVNYGFKSKGIIPLGNNQGKKGELCENCVREIDNFIQTRKGIK